MSRRYSFRVPASTSNLGAGFDALSLALQRYLKISVEPAAAFEIVAKGLDASSIPTTPDNLIRWIRDPQGVEPGTVMPNMGVAEADARDIAAYLYTLR